MRFLSFVVIALASLFPATLLCEARAQDSTSTAPSSIVVESARRFRNNDSHDITDLVRNLVSGDSLTLENTSEAFPEGGSQTSLELKYRRDGKEFTTTLSDGGHLQLGDALTSFVRSGRGIMSVAQAVTELRKRYPKGVLVLDAHWGQGPRVKDVTDDCQRVVSGESLTIPASEEAFPVASNGLGSLQLTYFDGKEAKTTEVRDNATFQLGNRVTSFIRYKKGLVAVDQAVAQLREKYPTGLLVLDARSITNNQGTDVTDVCQRAVSGNSLTIPVTDEAFSQGWSSNNSLRLTYFDGQDVKTREMGGGGTLQIGDKITAFVRYHKGLTGVDQAVAELRKKYPTGLLVLDARWGNGDNNWKDVTSDCQRVAWGDSMTVPNLAAAFHESEGSQKQLQVTYYDGESLKSTTAFEGGTIQIGDKITGFVRKDDGLLSVQRTVDNMSKAADHTLLILDATWGTPNASADVRNFLQSHVVHNNLSIVVGGDNWPDSNNSDKRADKYVNVLYWDGAGARRQRAREGERLALTTTAMPSAETQPALAVATTPSSILSDSWPVVAAIGGGGIFVGFLVGLLFTRKHTRQVSGPNRIDITRSLTPTAHSTPPSNE